jgi:hypothetical protein
MAGGQIESSFSQSPMQKKLLIELLAFLVLLLGQGSGAAQVAFSLSSVPVVTSRTNSFYLVSHWVIATNVDVDGKVDLVSANWNDGTLSVFTNNGSGGFNIDGVYPVGNSPRSVVAADVNGDGRLDLICANQGDNTLTVLTNNGNGGVGFLQR